MIQTEWRDRLIEAMRNEGVTVKELARLTGIGAATIYSYLTGRRRRPRDDAVFNRFATALNVNPQWLILGVGDMIAFPAEGEIAARMAAEDAGPDADLAIFGAAEGGIAGTSVNFERPVGTCRRPPGVVGERDAYALWVAGSSMSPALEHGDLVVVSRARPPPPGDFIVVQLRIGDGRGRETWIKRLRRQTDDEIDVEQFNPCTTITYPRRGIVFAHRVLSTANLCGL